MNPLTSRFGAARCPHSGWCAALLAAVLVFCFAHPAEAQKKRRNKSSPAKKADVNVRESKAKKTQYFDFSAMELSGSERKPQLLYFLDRANEELERAALERRSFIPEMVRSLDEEAL